MRLFLAPFVFVAFTTVPFAVLVATETTPATEQEEVAVKPYPNDLCLVTDEKLGSMGEPYVITSDGYEVKTLYGLRRKDFNSNKEEYLAKLKKLHEEAASTDSEEDSSTTPRKEHDHAVLIMTTITKPPRWIVQVYVPGIAYIPGTIPHHLCHAWHLWRRDVNLYSASLSLHRSLC